MKWLAVAVARGCHRGGHQVFQQPYQNLLAGAAIAGVAELDRDVRADVERLAHLVLVVGGPQPELPGAVPLLPFATAGRCRNLCPRTLLASVTPAARCQRRPAVGRPGRTQPPCGRDGAGYGRRVRASDPAVAVLAPACRARQHSAQAAAVPAESLSLARKRVQAEVPSGLAASSAGAVGTATRKHIAALPRIPGRQPVNLGRQRHRRINHASAGYQQVSLSVTTSP